ncbi:hypothetical protein Tco_0935600 [Tanacetum coccineum]
MPTEMELTLEQTQQGVSYEVSFDESNANVLERFYTLAGNPIKEILLKLNLPDHRILKNGGEETFQPTSLSSSCIILKITSILQYYYRSQESVGCSSSQADLYLTEKELHQLHLDEEALRETLEEKAMDKKARKEKIRQKQADDDEFFMEFGVVRYDS